MSSMGPMGPMGPVGPMGPMGPMDPHGSMPDAGDSDAVQPGEEAAI